MSLSSTLKWVIGIGTALVTAFIFLRKSIMGTADKEAMKRARHEIDQEKAQKRITEIENEQGKILVDVEKAKELEEEQKNKIKAIAEKAADEIKKVTEESNVGKINDTVNSDLQNF